MQVQIFLGKIIHCKSPYSVEVIKTGFIIVDDDSGTILALGDQTNLEEIKSKLNCTVKELFELRKSQLLLPGFIDTHLHAPQYPNVGLGYDQTLLGWLQNYTFKIEGQYCDSEFSKKVYNGVVRKTLDYGTTTGCYFASMFLNSSLQLVDAVTELGQRALVGKINMIKFAPENYLETAEESFNNTLKFIAEVKIRNNPLVSPIITPRFALSVDMDLMKKLAVLAKEENINIQSHISENKDEVEMVNKLYQKPYANVYHDAGLLTPKTVLAHGIYLSQEEINLLRESGTSIAHCPESNTLLRSGLCDVINLKENGVNVGLGTDISGGASPSIINAMKSAVIVSNHISFVKKNHEPLTYIDAFYLATLGGAKALALDHKIGNFEVNKSFDAIVVDMDPNEPSSAHCILTDYAPLELLQKLVFVGDDRNVIKVFVNGRCVKQ